MAQRDARMAWWRDARFGMFIHWGVFAVPAGVHDGERIAGYCEWIMNGASIPIKEYREKYAARFNPTQFDADEWVQLAKQAGMKYIVITSKHHDGFAMFDSKATDFDIMDATPFKRDVIRELADACRKEGIRFGVYYSQTQDWSHPGGRARPAVHARDRKTELWDPAQEGDFDSYVDTIVIPQVRELLTNYGQVDVFWWDTPMDTKPEQVARMLEPLALQPQLIVNDRLGAAFKGDIETPEQHIPATGFPGRDWETCMTMNDHFGYCSYDDNYKSTKTLLRNLIDIASKGGNYLLNIGPTAGGIVPEPQVRRLQNMGRWLDKNGDAIYGTSASPFTRESVDGRVTVKGNTVYLHVFDWPANGARLIGLMSPVKTATFLADGKPAQITTGTDDDGNPILTVARPDVPDPIATVVALELDGPLQVRPYVIYVKPAVDGAIVLNASEARIVATMGGDPIRYYGGDQVLDFIGHWQQPEDYVEWPVEVPAAGRYRVAMTYSSEDDHAGSEYAVAVGDSQVTGTVAGTGDWQKFTTVALGELDLPAGQQTLTVKAVRIPHHNLMNLHQLRLEPVAIEAK